jgi:5-methylthioadenosine/S-adenosylhomocysteine deaminase
MRDLLLENAAVLTCDPEDRFLPRGRVVIRDGRIVSIDEPREGAHAAMGPADRPDLEQIDVSGCIVIPGFINAHTHLWLSLLRGSLDDLTLFPWLRALDEPVKALSDDDILAASYFGLAESLRSGTTCVCECCRYRPDLAAGVAAALGSRLVVGGMPPSEWFGAEVPHDYPRLLATTRRTAVDHGGGRGLVSVWLGAHSPYNCSPEFLREAKRAADAVGYDFYIHLAECRDEVDVLRERHGRTPVQYAADLGLLDARTVAVHCVWLDDEDIRLFRQSGARIAHCPVSNAKLGSGVAPVPRYRRERIAVGLGTDSMVSNNTQSMLQEMRFAVLIQRVRHQDAAALTARDALRMATIEAARVVGLERLVGSIEVGKRADLVLLRTTRPWPVTKDQAMSEVVYSAQRDEIEAVYVDGERVVDRGRLTRVDEVALRARMLEGTRHGRG